MNYDDEANNKPTRSPPHTIRHSPSCFSLIYRNGIIRFAVSIALCVRSPNSFLVIRVAICPVYALQVECRTKCAYRRVLYVSKECAQTQTPHNYRDINILFTLHARLAAPPHTALCKACSLRSSNKLMFYHNICCATRTEGRALMMMSRETRREAICTPVILGKYGHNNLCASGTLFAGASTLVACLWSQVVNLIFMKPLCCHKMAITHTHK